MPYTLPTYDESTIALFTDTNNHEPIIALKLLVGVPFMVRRVVTYPDKRYDDKPTMRMSITVDSFPLDENGDRQTCVTYTTSQAMMRMLYNIATQVGKIITPKDTMVEFTDAQAPLLTVEAHPNGFGQIFQSIRSTRTLNGQPMQDKLFDYPEYEIAQAAATAKRQATATAQTSAEQSFPF